MTRTTMRGPDGYVVRDLLRRRHSVVNAVPSRRLQGSMRDGSSEGVRSDAVARPPVQLALDFAPPPARRPLS